MFLYRKSELPKYQLRDYVSFSDYALMSRKQIPTVIFKILVGKEDDTASPSHLVLYTKKFLLKK